MINIYVTWKEVHSNFFYSQSDNKAQQYIQQQVIYKFLETNGLLGANQGGFRKCYRTVDHIFILKTTVNKYVYKCKKKVYIYACFIYACKNYSYFSKLYVFEEFTLLMICWLYRATLHLVDLGNNNVLVKFWIFYIRVKVQDIPLDVPFADWIQLGLVDFSLTMVWIPCS